MALTVVFNTPGHAALLERDLPPPAAGQVRVRVETSLVSSGTEKTLLLKVPKYPIEPGYSAVGRITAVGPGVPHLSVGDRVVASDTDGLRAWLKTLPGGRPAASIELASGPQAVDTAIECTRRRGRVVTASLVPTGHSVNLFGRAWMEGLQLVGAYINSRPWRLDATEVTSPWDWPVRPYDNGRYVESEIDTTIGDAALFLRLLELGRFDLAPIVDEAVEGRDAADLFNRLPHSSSLGHLIRWA